MTARSRRRPPAAVPEAPLRIRLTLDSGLASYVRAFVKGIGIYGDERGTIIHMIRQAVQEDAKSDNLLSHLMPHLPARIQLAWLHRLNVPNPLRKSSRVRVTPIKTRKRRR